MWRQNFFQPSFKLESKTREGAKVTKKYFDPATPYERLLADSRVTEECKEQLRLTFSTLDPVHLLNQIREAQRELVQQETSNRIDQPVETDQDLSRFVESLSTAWRDGEVRPTHRKQYTGPRAWRRRPDGFGHEGRVIAPPVPPHTAAMSLRPHPVQLSSSEKHSCPAADQSLHGAD